jgi:hypothetical protein
LIRFSSDLTGVVFDVNQEENDPFSDWSKLMHKRVFSIDGKNLGLLSRIISDYMIVSGGFIYFRKYVIPKTLGESVSKKGIRLKISEYEADSAYSYAKMKNLITSIQMLPGQPIESGVFFERFGTLRYSTTRNRLAAGVAFVSGILFLISGYKANLAIYHLIQNEIVVYTAKEFLMFVLIPVGVLALLSQLGGITVLIGAGLFAANRINLGKFLVAVGTGQGLLTVLLRILSGLWSGSGSPIDNNYISWLTSSASGLGVLFAVISQTLSKGKDESIYSRMLRVVTRKSAKEE